SKPKTPRPIPGADAGCLQRLVRRCVHIFKNLRSLSPNGDRLRVTSVALASQILFAPLRLGVLAIKNETQSRKDAKSQSIKPASVAPPNVPDQRPRATDVQIATQTRSRGSLHPACSATCISYRQWLNLD